MGRLRRYKMLPVPILAESLVALNLFYLALCRCHESIRLSTDVLLSISTWKNYSNIPVFLCKKCNSSQLFEGISVSRIFWANPKLVCLIMILSSMLKQFNEYQAHARTHKTQTHTRAHTHGLL